MKRFSGLLSVFIIAVILLQTTFTAYADTSLKSQYTGSTYSQQSRFDGFEITNGIDVSEYQKTIDFKKVKADGIDFAFVRVGYTGYTKAKFSLNYDKYYKTYLNDAIDAGIEVGAYWYSQALTESEARAEADKLVSVLSGYDITMPVVMDYEFASTSAGRLDSAKLSKAKMTANALAFLETVRNAGYTPMFYANENFLKNSVNADTISAEYPIWLASYTTKTSYAGDFEYWQYSSSGSVSGISGRVDVNFHYVGGSARRIVSGLTTKSRSTNAIRITWNKIVASEAYVIYMYNDKSKKYEAIATVNPNVNNYRVEKLKAGSTYKFRVAAVIDGVEGKQSDYIKTVTKPKKVYSRTAKSPSSKKLTANWSKTTAAGYQVQWSTNKNFSSNTKTVNVGAGSTKVLSKTIKTAQSKKKYYVRIRAYSKANSEKFYGSWSNVKSVYVK